MKKNNKKGFTIVELVIVIAVIAILAAVLIPTFTSAVAKANKSKALQEAKSALTVAQAEVLSDGKITANEKVYVQGDKVTTTAPTSGQYWTFTFTTAGNANAVTIANTDTTYNYTVDNGVITVSDPE